MKRYREDIGQLVGVASHHCHRCGAVLTDAESIRRGFGPECIEDAEADIPRVLREKALQIYKESTMTMNIGGKQKVNKKKSLWLWNKNQALLVSIKWGK